LRKVPIVREGNIQLSFDEPVVRQVCSLMKCGKVADECIGRLLNQTMECTLCYIALRLLKVPYQVERGAFCSVQRN
jgi:hypothetical protein